MKRQYTINPYTFVPLGQKCLPENRPEDIHHLWLDENRLTGKIHVKLVFVTPTVIPGKQTQGTADRPGSIETYIHNGHVAIPGSRIRGHLMSLMRALNSSPILQYEDRAILQRRKSNPRKGFIIDDHGTLKVQEIKPVRVGEDQVDECLVVHPQRYEVADLRLQNGTLPETDPKVFVHGASQPVLQFEPGKALTAQGTRGDIYLGHPNWGPFGARRFKHYLSSSTAGTKATGRWVKFLSWSGQDRDNRLNDMQTNQPMVHRNRWHLVNLDSLGRTYTLSSNGILKAFAATSGETARLLEERAENEATGRALKRDVLESEKLKAGDFVYFIVDEGRNEVKSIGRYYHYLFIEESVKERVDRANRTICNGPPPIRCIVGELGGWSPEEEHQENEKDAGMKGRIWVEMAVGPKRETVRIETKNLRIHASQPPKSKIYKDAKRKLFWNDREWPHPLWDNQDLNCGTYSFENPDPKNKKLWKQWSQAEVIMATEDAPVSYEFVIRVMNMSNDEMNLLLTALSGFIPAADGVLGQANWKAWCHKIGHSRSFAMGSAFMQVQRIERVEVNEKTWIPETIPDDLNKIAKDLSTWQLKWLQGDHIEALRRIMNFEGAYEGLTEEELISTKMTSPLGQKLSPHEPQEITWKKDDAYRPKGYEYDYSQPLPDPLKKQILRVIIKEKQGNPNRGGNRPGGGYNRERGRRS